MSEKRNREFAELRDKLGDYRVDPPGEVWSNIASGLGGGRRRRNAIILLATAASIALAVTLGITSKGFKGSVSGDLAESSIESKEGTSPSETQEPGLKDESEALVSDDIQLAESSKTRRLDQKVDQAISEIISEESVVRIAGNDPLVQEDQPDLAGQKEEIDQEVNETLIDQEVNEALIDQDVGEDYFEETGADIALSEDALEAYLDSVSGESESIGGDLVDNLSETPDMRWIIGAMMSPLYSFRDAEGTVMNSSGGGDIESGMIAYAGGVQVGFRPGSRLTIESGILYNKMGINIGDVSGSQSRGWDYDFSPISNEAFNANIIQVSNSIGNIVSNSGDIFLNNYKDAGLNELNVDGGFDGFENMIVLDAVQQNLEYLEIPLNLKYSVIDRDFELQLVGGLSTNFLVNNSVTAQTGEGREEIGYASNLNNVNYSGNAGVGMIYHFQSNFSLSLEPRFRYYLNSVNDNSLPATRPYTLGIYTGINFRF